jgi:hypothetical protein
MMRKNKAQPAGTSQTPGTADAAQGMNVVARTQGQLVRRRFFRHKGALAGMMLFGFIVLLATFSIGWGPLPGLWDKNPTSTGLTGSLMSPLKTPVTGCWTSFSVWAR